MICTANLKNSTTWRQFLWTNHKNVYLEFDLTVDYNSGRGTASLGHDVAGDTGIVPGIREAGFGDDEIMVASSFNDAFGAERLFIFQPFHLKNSGAYQ